MRKFFLLREEQTTELSQGNADHNIMIIIVIIISKETSGGQKTNKNVNTWE